MSPDVQEVRLNVEYLRKEVARLEEDFLHVKQKIMPEMMEKMSVMNAKVTALLLLLGLNVVMFSFVVQKLFDIAGRIKP